MAVYRPGHLTNIELSPVPYVQSPSPPYHDDYEELPRSQTPPQKVPEKIPGEPKKSEVAPPPEVVLIDHSRPPMPLPSPKRFVQATLVTDRSLYDHDQEFLRTLPFLSSKRGTLKEIQQQASDALRQLAKGRGFNALSQAVEEIRKKLVQYKPLKLNCKNFSDGLKFSKHLNGLVDSIIFTQCPGLTQFPTDLTSFARLTAICFAHTALGTLPESLGNCTSLTELRIVKHQLTQIPPHISRLTNLTMLTIQEGYLKEVPKELSRCSYLTSLDLSDNQVSTLPLELELLWRLNTLNLSDNGLSKWPLIWRIRNLTELALSRNYLSNIPPTIRNLVSLQSLHLKFCGIHEITPHISDLSHLTFLDLSNNQLQVLTPELGKCARLRHLILSNNQLRALPPLRSLEILELTGNPLIPVNPECQVIWQQRPVQR